MKLQNLNVVGRVTPRGVSGLGETRANPRSEPILPPNPAASVTRPTTNSRKADARLPRRLRRLERVWVGGHFPRYFLTICVDGRRGVLLNDNVHERLLTFLKGSPERYGWWPTRYVIMPDHIHLLAGQAIEAAPLGAWVKALKAFVGQKDFRWQKGFFDHVLRSDESESEKREYIVQNPVRAGLTAKSEDWQFAGEIFYDE